MLALSADEVGQELEAYLSSFYFHINADVPDDTSLSATASYPQNILGQRPVDCRVYAQISRHILTPGFLTRAGNFFTGTSAPYQFSDLYTSRVNYGVRNPNAGHQMLLIETNSGALLLNNDRVIEIENSGEEAIRSALGEVMVALGYELTDANLPMTHFMIVEDGGLPDAGDYESAQVISGN